MGYRAWARIAKNAVGEAVTPKYCLGGAEAYPADGTTHLLTGKQGRKTCFARFVAENYQI